MNKENAGFLLLFIKNPILGVVLAVVLAIALLIMSSVGMVLSVTQPSNSSSNNDGGYGFVTCQEGDKFDEEKFLSSFQDAGVFTDNGQLFLDAGRANNVDPVLLAAISFHETGKGKSPMVRLDNNPGGLYNSSAGEFFKFDSLAEGLDFMARNLNKNYISQGIVTIEQIGAKYAPIGVNDPSNSNANWVPVVSSFVADLGGLSMNCSAIGSGDFVYPIPNAVVTSPFSVRVHPLTGEVENHKGVDFACNVGLPIHASATGKVVRSEFNTGGYGNMVVLQHGDKYTLYGHMSERFVSVGDEVEQGKTVGACGSTGDSSGPHLHFEIQTSYFDVRVDPLPYLQGAKTKDE
jgi:murein DD-endopeptidase MepM/ murein hydrolase activator NlpD